jgi:hypothetical protein
MLRPAKNFHDGASELSDGHRKDRYKYSVITDRQSQALMKNMYTVIVEGHRVKLNLENENTDGRIRRLKFKEI